MEWMNGELLFQDFRLVPFRIDYTKEPKRFFKGIPQLMGSVRLYIECVQKSDLISLLSYDTNTFTA